MKLLYRELKLDEVILLKEIDRSEVIKESYVFENNNLELKDDYYDIKGWIPEEVDKYITRLKDIHKSGGFIYGAFNRNDIIGIIALDKRFLDNKETQMNLDLIYISKKFRKMNIGTSLVEKIIKEAKKSGAKYLYISSSPFKNTVDFYLKLGANPLSKSDVSQELYKKEPEDIHMLLKI